MTNEISGKSVLVTGGGRGIGRAASLLCAARGRAWSMVSNIACTWASSATLAWTAKARPPWASIAATTFSAAAASCM